MRSRAEGHLQHLAQAYTKRDTSNFALRIWHETLPVQGTIAETYLKRRGITGEIPTALRFHRACPRNDERLPALVSLFVDIKTNQPSGIHRTFLRNDGSAKVDMGKSKMMLGRSKGAVIKLTPDDGVTLGLSIAEGIETALTLLDAGFPVWATGCAGGIEDFPVLNGIESLGIFADHDRVGLEAANICARRWSSAGIESRIVFPKNPDTDFNDLVRSSSNG